MQKDAARCILPFLRARLFAPYSSRRHLVEGGRGRALEDQARRVGGELELSALREKLRALLDVLSRRS